MSRNNVFKLSGNMALGAQEAYPTNDFDSIKNSLKLLKSKHAQKKQTPQQPNVHHPQNQNLYGGSYSSNAAQRQPANSRNLQDYNGHNYQQGGQGRQGGYSNKDLYDQHYPSEQPSRAPRNQTQNYDYKPSYQKGSYDIKGSQKYEYKGGYDQPPRAKPPQQQRPQYKYQEEEYQPPKRAQRQQPKPSHQDYNSPNYGTSHEEKTIKQVNRENRVQIKEYDPSELMQCRMGCGRSFNPDSISKHEKICKKVFQKKRKEFNTQDQRLVAKDQKNLMRKGEMVERKIEEKKAKEKVPKWKAESLQLRAGVKQARDDDYAPSKEEQKMLDQAKSNSMVKCHVCGRSFNQQAGARHIPFCESQQKKNMMKRR